MKTLRPYLRCLLAAACLLPAFVAHAQTVETQARVIVRFKADTARARIASASDRVQVLAGGVGVALAGRAHIKDDTQVVTASGIGSAELARRLASHPNVAAVEVDQRMHVRALPNDPMFAQQWHLQNGQAAAINAQAAWDITTGSANVVVAVIDTGVRPDHEELIGKLLPGYDFISCDGPGDCSTANDSDGRDADPSDPGDWETVGGLFYRSSWHGTRVSSIIAANTNNARGIAGVSWGSRILPLRALGVGGGYISDIAAAIRWAAGLNVPGLPNNPYPARVINMSLGGSGSCAFTYQAAIDEARAAGTAVVAAAGNENGAVEQPANCAGVLAVAGLRHAGTKVGYSSFGAEIGIAAPAGNCVVVTAGQPCQFPIDAATNTGTTVPISNGYTTNINPNASYGTSFAAPQVAGVLALMAAQNPALTPSQLTTRLKLAARPFPTEAGLPVCPATDANSQCNCTTSTCGAGMLDALGAVTQALRPVANFSLASQATVGDSLSLDGSTSSAIGGATVTSYQWSVSGSGAALGNAAAAQASLSLQTAGTYSVTLTVTDSNGRSDSLTQTVSVGATGGTSSTSSSSSSSSSSSGGSSSSSGGGGGGSLSLAGVLAALMAGGLARRRRR